MNLYAGVNQVKINGVQTAFVTGDSVFIDVMFDEIIDVNLAGDIPFLRLALDHNIVTNADLVRGSGTNTLTFLYIVKNGESSSDLNYPDQSSLDLNNSQIIVQSTSANADITLPQLTGVQALGNDNVIITDNVPPAILSSYVVGDLTNDSLIPISFGGCFTKNSDVCSQSGYIHIGFDEGITDSDDSSISSDHFAFSGPDENQFCSVKSNDNSDFSSGDKQLRVKYFLDFGSNNNLNFTLSIIKNISDLSGNSLNASPTSPKPLNLEANGIGRFRVELVDNSQTPPASDNVYIGRGGKDLPCDKEHDHISGSLPEFYLLVPDVFTTNPDDSFNSTIFDRYIQDPFSAFRLIVNTSVSISRTFQWAVADPDTDSCRITTVVGDECNPLNLNDDYELILKPVSETGNPLISPINMKTQPNMSVGPLSFSQSTEFDVFYGPIYEIDSQSPTINTCPDSQTWTLDSGQCTTSMLNLMGSVVASDDFDTSLTVTQNIQPGTPLEPGNHIIKLTVQDDAFNQTNCAVEITVLPDNESPIISNCPTMVPGSAQENCQATVSWTEPIATDNCMITSFSSDFNQSQKFNIGTTLVTYTATDSNSNSTTCSFNVVVSDNEDPKILNCPTTVFGNAEENCQLIVSWTEPTATDNCTLVDFSSNFSSPNTFNLGTTLVTYTATDSNSNSTKCSFNVVVSENEIPVILLDQEIVTLPLDSSAPDRLLGVLVFDNCDSSLTINDISLSGTPVNMSSLGNYTVTYNVSDNDANAAITKMRTYRIVSSSLFVSRDLVLQSGWNQITLPVEPSYQLIRTLFTSQISTNNLLEIIGNGDSFKSNVPDSPTTLRVIESGYGYWINVNFEETMSIDGIIIDPQTMFSLKKGWNNVGYILSSDKEIDIALSDLIDESTPANSNLLMVIGEGKSYDPRLPTDLNTLTHLNPGFGYWIKVGNDQNFRYQE